MNLSLTKEQISLSRKYLLYKFFSHLYFVGAVWLYFYRIFITDQQVGILDGMAFAIGLMVEIPSGALADRFGRDHMVKFGYLCAGFGFLIQACGSSFFPFFIGQAILIVGLSCISGADEALFFDKLQFHAESVHWRKLLTRGSQVALIASLMATILGSWLHLFDPRLPWILTGVALLCAIPLVWNIRDDRVKQKGKNIVHEMNIQLTSICSGFTTFISASMLIYVPLLITVQGLFYAADSGILRMILLDRFHFDPVLGAVVLAVCSLSTAGILALMHRCAENMSEKYVISTISCSAIVALVLSMTDLGMWGCMVIFILYAGEHILYPFMSEVINSRVGQNERATALSVASFLRSMPYVLLGPVIGYLNTVDKLEYFLGSWSLLMAVVIGIYITRSTQGTL